MTNLASSGQEGVNHHSQVRLGSGVSQWDNKQQQSNNRSDVSKILGKQLLLVCITVL